MKSKLKLGTAAALAVACIGLLCAVGQTNNFYSPPTNGIAVLMSHATFTNYFKPIALTNLVAEQGKWYAQTDAMNKIPVSDEGLTNIINALVSSREFCRIRGHAWGDHMHVTLEYISGKISCRECKLCGAHQTLYADWK